MTGHAGSMVRAAAALFALVGSAEPLGATPPEASPAPEARPAAELALPGGPDRSRVLAPPPTARPIQGSDPGDPETDGEAAEPAASPLPQGRPTATGASSAAPPGDGAAAGPDAAHRVPEGRPESRPTADPDPSEKMAEPVSDDPSDAGEAAATGAERAEPEASAATTTERPSATEAPPATERPGPADRTPPEGRPRPTPPLPAARRQPETAPPRPRPEIDAGEAPAARPQSAPARAPNARPTTRPTTPVPSPEADAPSSDRPPGDRASVCQDPRLAGAPAPPITGDARACGQFAPVRITAIDGVRLSQPAVLGCPTARAVADWVAGTLRPAAREIMGSAPLRLRIMGSYACRGRNRRAGGPLSEHAHGRAIDIGGVALADGRRVSVLRHWGRGAEGRLLARLRREACGRFGTVLGPGSDRFHDDHFHFDTAPRRAPYCR
ncbi:MAG: extensin family protein [Paracoccaceae bacterium]